MYSADKQEKEILDFWKKDGTFEQSVTDRPEDKPYVFYDGPPFATGLPHYGHILSSVIKDVVPRYQTMQGYRVRRRWGWDCHGLPIESLIEKELGISGKKDIEEKIGVAEFNNACRNTVLKYTEEWKEMVDREGRWIEFDNAYKTMDSTFMESVWWALKQAWDKELIYEGRKVLQYCPRCETPISKAETNMDNSYRDVTEEAVTIRFKLKQHDDYPENTSILAWTTTPWTLPGNVALAVGSDIEYYLVKLADEHIIIAKERLMHYLEGQEFEIVTSMKGAELVGLEYEQLYTIPAADEQEKKGWYVVAADFVTTEDGTGIVHTAVIYGEDDYELGLRYDLPMVQLLDQKGHFNNEAPELIQGDYLKKAEKTIKKDLEDRGLLFDKSQNTHSYPHCWRCETPLFYNAVSAWFINIQKIKPRLIELNKQINWHPAHLKEGRFLHILETAPDWNISRNRYWATPLPFWKCDSEACDGTACVGSVAELKEQATNFDEVYSSDKTEEIDLHKHMMDQIVLSCPSCSGTMTRIPEVIDCWVESASMPFAEFHYPFDNKDVVEARQPGHFVAEYIAQTRAWFYYMHVMSVLLFDKHPFDNVVTTGTILNEKGEKLSKSKKNYPDPWKIIEQYGVDALRYYLMTSVVMQAENLFFNERDVRDVFNKVINTLWNVHTFYKMYAPEAVSVETRPQSEHVLDQWVLSRLSELITVVTEGMDGYDIVRASRPITLFINDLSTWYVRRSRDRFKGDDEADKVQAVATLGYVLAQLSKVIAPTMPFIAERIYQDVTGSAESVHLQTWPTTDTKDRDDVVLKTMADVRSLVEYGMSVRKETGIRVRQPLQAVAILDEKITAQYQDILADELNVKEVMVVDDINRIAGSWTGREEGALSLALQTDLTDELKKEGLVREVVRAVSQLRKEQKLTRDDRITLTYESDDALVSAVFAEYADEIAAATLADTLAEGEATAEVDLNGHAARLRVDKV